MQATCPNCQHQFVLPNPISAAGGRKVTPAKLEHLAKARAVRAERIAARRTAATPPPPPPAQPTETPQCPTP